MPSRRDCEVDLLTKGDNKNMLKGVMAYGHLIENPPPGILIIGIPLAVVVIIFVALKLRTRIRESGLAPPISQSVIEAAWRRASGHCECPRDTHDHGSIRCERQLAWADRGREGIGAWEATRVEAGGGDTLSNCEILCWNSCRATP